MCNEWECWSDNSLLLLTLSIPLFHNPTLSQYIPNHVGIRLKNTEAGEFPFNPSLVPAGIQESISFSFPHKAAPVPLFPQTRCSPLFLLRHGLQTDTGYPQNKLASKTSHVGKLWVELRGPASLNKVKEV